MICTVSFAYCDTNDCPNSEQAFPDAIGLQSVKELRAMMKADGWRRIAGMDFCPECAKSNESATEQQ